MKFYCKYCDKKFQRDMRLKTNRYFWSKRGYRSSCETVNEKGLKTIYYKPI